MGWTIAFLSRPLSNKEVVGSTEVNPGDFLRPSIYCKIEMKVIFTERFSLIYEFPFLMRQSLEYYESLSKKNHM